MNLKQIKHHNELIHQYFSFRLVMQFNNLFFVPFYYITLFKTVDSFDQLFLERAFYFVGIWIGFMSFSFIIDRLGYLRSTQLSIVLQALSMVFMLVFINQIEQLFLIFAFIRAFARGTYWPTFKSISLKEIHGSNRGRLLNLFESTFRLMDIALPFLGGALLAYTGNIEYILILTIVIHLSSLLYPWKYNKKPRSKIRSSEVTRILKRDNINLYILLQFFYHAILELFVTIFLVVPFIILGSEFEVGTFAAFIGLTAAIISYVERNFDLKRKLKIAYAGFSLRTILTFLLVIFWNTPLLAIRGLSSSISQSVSTPVLTDIDFRNQEKLLGDFKNESALEMILIRETVIEAARIFVLILAFFFVREFNTDQETVIRIAMFLLAPYSLIVLFFLNKMNKSIKIGNKTRAHHTHSIN